MGYRVINGKLLEFQSISDYSIHNNTVKTNRSNDSLDFENILDTSIKEKNQFTLSNHAAERLKLRNIDFNETDMKKINDGINKANEKGSKDCLILYKDVALVTSIKNRTIVTAVDKNSSKGNVFTNIDSVVLL
ncbi:MULTISPECIES: TIGR02530 family flagellar biosynthesis protein [Clostridium]|uniref:TIGR02530 family flagellar biosynthesis protein n=1 Tax=Clostridium TaxID=1485 RepID=UPI00082438D5|nr:MULTISPECIES: TIGR02530 family flagellar biosynthesis protein [Clostridium]PJI09872.1 flagellar biosynthesis protein [Clostridium sp. CT7]